MPKQGTDEMFESNVLDDAIDDSAARRPRTAAPARQRRSKAADRVAARETAERYSARLKTDGRHFFFAPSSWLG